VLMNWCRSCEPNFGDMLGPVLYRRHGHDVTWAPPALAEIFTVGSILSKVPERKRVTIVGTGFIRPEMTKDLRRANVLAIRGERSRKAARLGPATLGDLGVLVDELPRTEVAPIDVLAIPHHVDHDLATRYQHTAAIRGDAAVLLGSIAAAGLVVTSSLHALIAADALGIPHVLAPHPGVIGGLYKFDDYASAFGESIIPGRERLTPRLLMAAKQAELRALL
jgi:pyruvyltransferase